jgi:hypothetical protein
MYAEQRSEGILLLSYAGMRRRCNEQPIGKNNDVVKRI